MGFNSDSNVIDLGLRRKSTESVGKNDTVNESAPIVDMSERRQEMLQDERRAVKRTILTEFIGAFIVVPQHGLCEVTVYDISDQGLGFDIQGDRGCLRAGEEVAMRIYMNQHTYFPFVVTVNNVREVPEEGVFRHGAGFVNGSINEVALHHFVKFIENVSSCLEKDSGDVLVSNLSK